MMGRQITHKMGRSWSVCVISKPPAPYPPQVCTAAVPEPNSRARNLILRAIRGICLTVADDIVIIIESTRRHPSRQMYVLVDEDTVNGMYLRISYSPNAEQMNAFTSRLDWDLDTVTPPR
jgi:hypothetical protein